MGKSLVTPQYSSALKCNPARNLKDGALLGIESGFTFNFPPILDLIAVHMLQGQHGEGRNWYNTRTFFKSTFQCQCLYFYFMNTILGLCLFFFFLDTNVYQESAILGVCYLDIPSAVLWKSR